MYLGITFIFFRSNHLLSLNRLMNGFYVFCDTILFHKVFQIIRNFNWMNTSETVDIQLDLFDRTTKLFNFYLCLMV